jgi:hypothetical protein
VSENNINAFWIKRPSDATSQSKIYNLVTSSFRDMLDRIGWLLSIHKSLRLLYPRNEHIRYTWVNRRNRILDDQRPLDIMTSQGLIGIARVARFLDFLRGL